MRPMRKTSKNEVTQHSKGHLIKLCRVCTQGLKQTDVTRVVTTLTTEVTTSKHTMKVQSFMRKSRPATS